MIDYREYIEYIPAKLGVKAAIKGSSVTVYDILSWMANGKSIQDILNEFPQLRKEEILACLAYAANR